MTKQSSQMFYHQRDARHKYEYFVLGISAALFGYIGESFVPEKLSISQNTIELTSLCLLGASFIVGLLRVEKSIHIEALNYKRLQLQEDKSELISTLHDPIGRYSSSTGQQFDPDQAKRHLDIIESSLKELEIWINGVTTRGEWLSIARKWTLFGGISTLLIAKLVGPYSEELKNLMSYALQITGII